MRTREGITIIERMSYCRQPLARLPVREREVRLMAQKERENGITNSHKTLIAGVGVRVAVFDPVTQDVRQMTPHHHPPDHRQTLVRIIS